MCNALHHLSRSAACLFNQWVAYEPYTAVRHQERLNGTAEMRRATLKKRDFNLSDGDGSGSHVERSTEVMLETLVTLIACGDEAAFRRLYDATVSRVHHLAYLITRRAELAEETVPEVYLQAWREAGRFDPGRAGALTWLLVICRSRALDCLRRCDRAQVGRHVSMRIARGLFEEVR